MNNYPAPKPALTAEQQALIDQFNTAIGRSDEVMLEGIITRLDSIPDEFSPIRQLIRSGSSESIEALFKTARTLIASAMDREFQQQLQIYQLQWEWRLENFQAGKSSDLHIEPFKFDVSIQHKASHSSLTKNIYRNAIWAYAFKGESNKVDELLSSYSTFSNGHSASMYMYVITGYMQGGFSQKIPSTMLDELFAHSLKCRKRNRKDRYLFRVTYATADELIQEENSKKAGASFKNILECYYDAGLHEELTTLCRKYIMRLEKMIDIEAQFSLFTLYESTAYYAHPLYVSIINILLKLNKLGIVFSSLPGAHYFKDKKDSEYDDEYASLKTIYNNIFQHCFANKKEEVVEKLCIQYGISADARRNGDYGYFDPLYIFIIQTLAQLGKIDVVSYFLMQEKHYTPYSFLVYFNHYAVKIYPAALNGYRAGKFDFEAEKLRKVAEIIRNNINTSASEKSEKIFEAINAIEDVELKKALLIDCIHKKSYLALAMWTKNYSDSSTPSLKRGTLQKVVHALIDLGVDIAKIPGCEEFSKGIFGYTYPSKKRGLAPFHHFAPKFDEQVSMTMLTASSTKDDSEISEEDEKPTPASPTRAIDSFNML